jgi:transposase
MPLLLTKNKRWAIVTHRADGLTLRAIAEQEGVSLNGVVRILDLHDRTGDVIDETQVRKKKKIAGVAAQLVTDTMVGHPHQHLRGMKKTLRVRLGLKVSHVAIGNFLNARGFKPRRRLVSIKITAAQRAKRLAFAHRFVDKPKKFWDKVMFEDEKSFGAAWKGNPKNDIVWGDANTPIPDRHVSAYQSSVKVGAAISWKGKTGIHVFADKWNGPAYGNQLKASIFPYVQRHYHGEPIAYFQDNDPSHLTAPNKKLLRDKELLFEDDYKFPPNSGDLNPIENVWSIVLTRMEGDELSDRASIIASIEKAWRRVDVGSLRKMLHSMPERLAACIAAGGARTRW